MKKILLVEDNETIIMGLKYSLEQENFRVITAKNVEESREKIKQEQIDIVLLDVSLPDGNGFDICKEIKEKQDTPVIFLTAQDEETSVVLGLDLGADDYIVKPFEIMELLARIEVVLRRYHKLDRIINILGLEIDTDAMCVKKEGKEINLTKKEYDTLLLFARNPGNVLFREIIYERVWGGDYIAGSRTVDLHVQRVRKKVGWEDFLITVPKMGYRLEVPR